jgi:hypothetical protein
LFGAAVVCFLFEYTRTRIINIHTTSRPPRIPPTKAPVGVPLLDTDCRCGGNIGDILVRLVASCVGFRVGESVGFGMMGAGGLVIVAFTGDGGTLDIGLVVILVKHISRPSVTQYSAVTIDTSGISCVVIDDEPLGKIADVLHIYR